MIKVPASRIGFIIGENGKVKEELQQSFGANLKITKDGTVEIAGEEGLNIYKLKNAVEGIARGLSLETVLNLCDDNYTLDIIHLPEILGKNENAVKRYKSRIIGSDGKIKKQIEKKTGTDIAVHGKTVAIIGKYDNVANARSTVLMILEGNDFNAVFKHLDRLK
ncbi:MAG: KH domain-containing protein [archaeon]|nr:KH domain-containing protein [archaeon]